jgi:hypothetical protein
MEQAPNLEVDQGQDFGTWEDTTSIWLYHQLPQMLFANGHLKSQDIVDLGGANGRTAQWAPPDTQVTTVDYDARKNPDVVADICDYTKHHAEALVKLVSHYMPDKQLISFVDNINADRIVLVDIVCSGDELRTKYKNSVGEGLKHFRTPEQLNALYPPGAKVIMCPKHYVSAEFYENRLGLMGATPHFEQVMITIVER